MIEAREELRDRVRDDTPPPDESQVVLRGGPDTGLLIRTHARRVNRLFVLDGGEVWAISVFVALDEIGTGSTNAILRTKVRSYDHVLDGEGGEVALLVGAEDEHREPAAVAGGPARMPERRFQKSTRISRSAALLRS